MKHIFTVVLLSVCCPAILAQGGNDNQSDKLHLLPVNQVKIEDKFWNPKFNLWKTVTANDVLNKFEGQYTPFPVEGLRDAFKNFDDVAAGKRNTGKHDGPEWYDGLVYETLRGVADFLAATPDKKLEARVDGYIDRICAAQQTDPDGYINTHTQLVENDHRWGDNGGYLRGQHDVYNAGMLVEAGIHYYQATGKTKLLEAATRFANYMAACMGPEPKRNIVPAHSGPEEALVKLYWLYTAEPGLKKKINFPVDEGAYLGLAKFWIENRGHHCGFPVWETWGYGKSDRWIRDAKYNSPEFGSHSRPCWGEYAQDSIPVFQQKTIEGHAVRATLLGTGIAAVAIADDSPEYIESSRILWDNMVGKRYFITGGVGAIHHDEKFGPDYFLPTDAYLETCAAVGTAFFSQRMNQLTKEAKYMDELERSLYNNILAGISVDGKQYTYQNPLNTDKFERWEWHVCPCCPPMFLKMMSAVPGFIYAYQGNDLYVNLFIGSETEIPLASTAVTISQETTLPWDGDVKLKLSPGREELFTLKIRIPGWAQGVENPYGLYRSGLSGPVQIRVNGASVQPDLKNGYAGIRRQWKKGDRVDIKFPVKPRLIYANNLVDELKGKAAVAAGPLIYNLESSHNKEVGKALINPSEPLKMVFSPWLLGGVNQIEATGIQETGEKINLHFIPYYAIGNQQMQTDYRTWITIHN